MPLANYIWYEKYRPHSLREMTLSQGGIFVSYLDAKDIPHLLFHGPPGSGKTTLALILIEGLKAQKLILNASSEDRGIKTIRGMVKRFAMSRSLPGKKKIVFLDEADGLTSDAQPALRNTMETYSGNCRFILTANYLDKIIEPIRSRCTAFAFTKYPKKKLLRLLMGILDKEDVNYDLEDVEVLVKRLYPDIRTIINNLQAGSIGGTFELDQCLTARIDPKKIGKLIGQGKLRGLRELWMGATEFLWLYKYLFDVFVPSMSKEREEGARIVGEYIYRDSSVVDREINVSACCIELMVLLGKEVVF